MNIKGTTIFLALAILLTACAERKERSFFASDGIKVGAAKRLDVDRYQIPIEFETSITHSGQWIYDVVISVSGKDIYVTARFDSESSQYPGFIRVDGVTPGTYQLFYRDPDKSVHFISKLELP